MCGNTALRIELDRIITNSKTFKEYSDEIERLRAAHRHDIIVFEETNRHQGVQPTCYAFALGLAENDQYREILREEPEGTRPPIDKIFVNALVSGGQLATRDAPYKKNDIVLYLVGTELKHAGTLILENGRVRSKWGPLEVHEHDMWEVPNSYGDAVNFYFAPDPSVVLGLLRNQNN